jgi:hypothetical protein
MMGDMEWGQMAFGRDPLPEGDRWAEVVTAQCWAGPADGYWFACSTAPAEGEVYAGVTLFDTVTAADEQGQKRLEYVPLGRYVLDLANALKPRLVWQVRPDYV